MSEEEKATIVTSAAGEIRFTMAPRQVMKKLARTFPVAAKIALPTLGPMRASGGSPMPPGGRRLRPGKSQAAEHPASKQVVVIEVLLLNHTVLDGDAFFECGTPGP